jgi:hypothetical protein
MKFIPNMAVSALDMEKPYGIIAVLISRLYLMPRGKKYQEKAISVIRKKPRTR